MQLTALTQTPPAAVPQPAAPPIKAVIAHRGYHKGNSPYENTVAAYLAAMRLGVDLMETDVRRTADGVLVLYHDASIGGRSIAKTKYADLPKLPNGEAISTLQGLVDAMAGAATRTRVLVETKEFGYEHEVITMLRSKLSPDQFELMSFNLDSVRALRRLAPDAKVGVLIGLAPDWQNVTWPITGAAMVAKARELGVDFVAIDRHLANDSRLDALSKAGIPVSVWTVDDPAELKRLLADPRVSRIITDMPDVAMKLRSASVQDALRSESLQLAMQRATLAA